MEELNENAVELVCMLGSRSQGIHIHNPRTIVAPTQHAPTTLLMLRQ